MQLFSYLIGALGIEAQTKVVSWSLAVSRTASGGKAGKPASFVEHGSQLDNVEAQIIVNVILKSICHIGS